MSDLPAGAVAVLPWLHWYGNAVWALGGAAWAGGEQWSRSLAKWRKRDVLAESSDVCPRASLPMPGTAGDHGLQHATARETVCSPVPSV